MVVWQKTDILLTVENGFRIIGSGQLISADDEDDKCEVNLEGQNSRECEFFLIKMSMSDERFGWLLSLDLRDDQSPPCLFGRGYLTEDSVRFVHFPF